MKKRLAVLGIACCCAAAFVGCGKDNSDSGDKEEVTKKAEETSEPGNEAMDNEADDEVDYSAQIQIIADNADVWKNTSEYEMYSYTVTDLDGNGRLELIASYMAGTGMYTFSDYYEVNEALDGISLCTYDVMEGDSQPDIMLDEATRYSDASTGTNYYIIDDVLRNGMSESYVLKDVVVLKDGVVTVDNLGVCANIGDEDGNVVSTYQDANGNEITEEEYGELENIYKEYKKETVKFNWVTLEDGSEITDILTQSFDGFGVED